MKKKNILVQMELGVKNKFPFLTETFFFKLAISLSVFFKKKYKKNIIGKDTRLSSYLIENVTFNH